MEVHLSLEVGWEKGLGELSSTQAFRDAASFGLGSPTVRAWASCTGCSVSSRQQRRETQPENGTHALNPLSLEMTHHSCSNSVGRTRSYDLVQVQGRLGNVFCVSNQKKQQPLWGISCMTCGYRIRDVLQMHSLWWWSCGLTISRVRSKYSMVRMICLATFTLSPLHLVLSRKTRCILESYFCPLRSHSKQLPKQ